MNNRTTWAVAGVVSAAVSLTASGAVIAAWSMPTAVPTGIIGSSYSYGTANSGDSTGGSSLSGFHTLATTVWSSPSGNGSLYSLSSNGWTAGDYYQVVASTTGFYGVSISWNQTRSSTGPSLFAVQMSHDSGASWMSLVNYTVIQAGGAGTNTTSWNTTTGQAAFDMSVAAGAMGDGVGGLMFRFRSNTTSTFAGTNRIDNIVVSGSAVPAPGAIALLGIAGLLARRRR